MYCEANIELNRDRLRDGEGDDLNLAPPWPNPEAQFDNERIFILPKIITPEDIIRVQGQTFTERTKIIIGLVTGSDSPDHSNVACQFNITFNEQNKILIQTVEDGNVVTINDETPTSDYFKDPKRFDVFFRMRKEDVFDAGVGVVGHQVDENLSLIDSLRVKQDVDKIRFLSVHGDVEQVTSLKFTFGKL